MTANNARTAQELADECKRLAYEHAAECAAYATTDREAVFSQGAKEDALHAAIDRLAALASQAEPVARVIRNESGQVYLEWRDGKTPLDFVGATLCATPPAPAQAEPVAEVVELSEVVGFGRREPRKSVRFLCEVPAGAKLYAGAPAQAEQSEDGRDAARYRWLREMSNTRVDIDLGAGYEISDTLDAAIDAAIAAKEQS